VKEISSISAPKTGRMLRSACNGSHKGGTAPGQILVRNSEERGDRHLIENGKQNIRQNQEYQYK
jgi:hypothetical protein